MDHYNLKGFILTFGFYHKLKCKVLYAMILFAGNFMLLTQVIGPINDIEKEEGARKQDAGDDVNLFGAKLEGVHPFQNTVAASHWNVIIQ